MLAIINTIDPYALVINFMCHLTMFIGGLYIAIHARNVPNWLRTFLWYIGCSSFLIATTIICGWILGSSFELSYDNVGVIGETMFNIFISITTITYFYKTVVTDIKYSKMRSNT